MIYRRLFNVSTWQFRSPFGELERMRQVTGKNLAISGERKIDAEEESARYHRREREAGTFSRASRN